MVAHVLLFASAADLAGAPALDVPLSTDTTGADIVTHLAETYPPLAKLLPRCRIAINRQYVEPGHRVADGDEVAILPPVSGG